MEHLRGLGDASTFCQADALYKNQEATVQTPFGDTDWFNIGKGVQLFLFNLDAKVIMMKLKLTVGTQGHPLKQMQEKLGPTN